MKKKSLINTCLKVKEPVLKNSNLFWLYLTLVGIPTHHRKTPLDRKQPQEIDERCPLIKSHTYTSTRTATKNKSRKITVLKDYHIIQNCHWYCAKTEQHKQKSIILVRWDVKLTAIKSNNKLVCYTRNAHFLPNSLLEQTQVYFCCFEHID